MFYGRTSSYYNKQKNVSTALGELIPEEFALHSGRIGGAPRLAEIGEIGAPPRVIQKKRVMGVAGVYGIREVEYGGCIVGFQGAGGKDRQAEKAAGARNEVGRVAVKNGRVRCERSI